MQTIKPRRGLLILFAVLASQISEHPLGGGATLFAGEAAGRSFDLPRGPAADTLRQFSRQSGQQVVFMVDSVEGEVTNAVRGTFAPGDALDRMLAGTRLVAVRDRRTGALAVQRVAAQREAKPESRSEPGARSSSVTPAPSSREEAVVLTPFEVNSPKDRGYRRTNSVTTSRIGVSISEVPQAIQVISGEMLSDFSLNRADDVFQYSSSVVSHKNEMRQANQFQMRGFAMPRYLNGMQWVTGTYPYLSNDNIDRVEIAKGAVGLFFGNSSPNGVANYITKRPEFIERTDVTVAGGSFGYAKSLLDTQRVFSRNAGLAGRLIASWGAQDARINHQHAENLFIAPSLVISPSPGFKAEIEFNHTKFKQPYLTATSSWTAAINPQYLRDITAPSQEILNFFKATYRLATDAQALAKVQERWVAPAWNVFNINWQNDKLAITGTEPFFNMGSTVDWWRFSNEGDRWLGANPQSNSDGRSNVVDVGLTFTPTERVAFKYRWLRMESRQNFLRGTYAMNGGIRPDGRITSLAHALTTVTLDENERGVSDAQQLDASYRISGFGMQHTFTAGVEDRRLVSRTGNAPTNAALFATNTYRRYDSFVDSPPSLYAIVTGPTVISSTTVGEYRDAYASYRGSALEGRLHALAGYRFVRNLGLDRSNDTVTLGAVYEAWRGLHLFASRSNTFIITNAFNINGPGVLPSDNQRRLNDETGNGWEAGVKSTLNGDSLSGSVSVFKVERSGIVGNSSSNNATDPRNLDSNLNNDVRFQDNGGVQVSRGLDVDLVWTPSERFQAVFSLVNMWTARVLSDPSIDLRVRSRAYQRAFERRLTKAPRYSTTLVLKYNLGGDRFRGLSVGAAGRYSDAYEVVNTPNFDVFVPAEAIFDVFASYDRMKIFGASSVLQLNFKNLTNRINDITRGNGREVSASVRVRF